MAGRLFTSESVTEGHPDKICDAISDSVLDAILTEDPKARVAVETLVTTGQVHVAGEVTTTAYVDIPGIVRQKILEIGYDSSTKGFDGACPLGPWVETELDTSALSVRSSVNGELKQDGSTEDMVFDVPTLVSYVSEAFTLLPGDVILTGTPAGVGTVDEGDQLSVQIEGIGELTTVLRR